jgi:hypothetical protein
MSLSLVLRTLHILRRRQYVIHKPGPGTGEQTAWRVIKTLTGKPIPEISDEESETKIAAYLETHKVTKLPPARADGFYKSEFWDFDL